MQDVYLSLFVILAAGAMIALLAFLYLRKKRIIYRQLEDYCRQRGYQMNEVRERLRRTMTIHGEGWTLATDIQSSDVETDSGSSYMTVCTRWETDLAADKIIPLLWVGTVSRSQVKLGDSILPILTMAGITGKENMHFVALDEPLQKRFAMIAAELPALSKAGAEISRLLADWPETWPLRVQLGAGLVQLVIPGMKFDKPQDLDRVIRMGIGLTEYAESVKRYT